ncbi:MAG: hypothetical protein GY754_15855 [bacterium]|nr:hypothetical protein [bacterium]
MEKKDKLIEKQEELKKWIKKIGWSQNKFAQEYYSQLDEDKFDHEEDIEHFIGRFKKHIGRETTDIETIDLYLNFLYSLEAFRKLDYIKPYNLSEDEFDDEFNSKMEEISKFIDDELL